MGDHFHVALCENVQGIVFLTFLDQEGLILDCAGGHNAGQDLALCITEFFTEWRVLDGRHANRHVITG